MDGLTLAIWIVGFSLVAGSALVFWRISRRIRAAGAWPAVEATIHSAAMEKVESRRKASDLPCFAFSYVVKKRNYKGRFALRASGDRAGELMRQMVDKKMVIRYDPEWPQGWYIPIDTIGGCEVLQKLRPDLDPQLPSD